MAKGFRGGGFGGKSPMGGMNRSELMKQAQKRQEEMLKTQEELENRTYKATAGGGAVTAEVSGKRLITSLVIDPDAVDPDDVEMLQDMIIAAVNSALSDAEKTSSETMSRLTGGLNLGF
jgi:DNA-binding YbaB/EbfC family protein